MLDNTPDILSLTLVVVLVLNTTLKIWLAMRQMRHVMRHRGQVPAQFANTISLHAHQKAADYTLAKSRLGLFDIGLSAVILMGWTLGGGLSWLDHTLINTLGAGFGHQLALVLSFGVIGAVLELPLGLYQTFVLEARFGFNKTSWRLWLSDLIKSSVLGLVIGLPLVALVLWLMAAAGVWWWLWAWIVLIAFNLLMMVIYPTWIAPWFNTFTPLEDVELKERVEALMRRCGFSSKGLYVMDGSKRSAHANAYFTGFGAAKRVVFFDTLLKTLTPGEVDAVLAHELGHFKHRHILRRMAWIFTLSLLSFAVLGYLSEQAWFYLGLGVDLGQGASHDAMALVLFSLTLPLVSFFVAPLMSLMSREHEFQADAYAVSQTSGADLASALLKLYEDNASTLTPDPLYVRFYYSHPDAAQRLARMTPAST